MKKTSITMLAMFFATFAFSQKIKEKDVPESVKAAFQKHFPGATEIKWEKESPNYEVEFDRNKTEYSALFDARGDLLETEAEIEISALPKAVADYVNTHYPGKKIKEASKITDAKGTVTYEAEVNKKDLIFDSNGKFIKEEKDTDKD